jgi:elongator complex protein 3
MKQHRTPLHMDHGKISLFFYMQPVPCGGSCRFCIQDPGFTKSTISNEDTRMSRDCGWDPTCQIEHRFRQYNLPNGRNYKYGLGVNGDSFISHDPQYLRGYFKALYDYLNCMPSRDLAESRDRQADGADRCVWVKVETRPDQITAESCELMLELGVNTVELGVQTLDDTVLKLNRRGHFVDAVVRATNLLRTYGFEVGYHMMTGLPGSTDSLDYEVLTERLWEPRYSPDCLMIFPCVLMKDHRLQPQLLKLLESGAWDPLTDDRYNALLAAVLPLIPSSVFINRIQRIFPPNEIDRGPKSVIDRMSMATLSRCLWQRSVSRTAVPGDDFSRYAVSVVRHGPGYSVEASLRDGAVVLGYGKLSIFGNTAMVRDLRVLGNMTPVGQRSGGPQHIGIGRALLREMEVTATARGCGMLKVHPPVGARSYFTTLGFQPVAPYYLGKPLAPSTSLAERGCNQSSGTPARARYSGSF